MTTQMPSLRRLLAAALALASIIGCGHQVTPNPSTSDLSGEVLVRLRTAGPLQFSSFIYLIAVDICGPGVPYPNAAFTGYKSYSYAFLVSAQQNTGLPELYEYYVTSGNLAKLPVNNLSPSTTQFVPNDNGQGNEFELIFEREDLNNPLNLAQPCPNPTAPSSPAPFQGITTWTFNMMSFSQNGIAQDSLGPGGSNDQSFQGIVVDTTTTNQQSYTKPSGYPAPSNPSAQLIYGEVDNYL